MVESAERTEAQKGSRGHGSRKGRGWLGQSGLEDTAGTRQGLREREVGKEGARERKVGKEGYVGRRAQ